MKIRTQLIISMVFFVIALLIISASVIITNQQVEQLNKQQEIVKNVELKAGDLSYLSNDYLLYRESQQIDRWNSKYSSFSSDISNLRTNNPDQQVIINNIKVNQQRLKETFEGIVSSSPNTSQSQLNTIDPLFIQVSSSRLGVQTQGIVFDASRLSQELHNEEEQLNQLNILLISALLGTVVLFLLTNYFLIYRRTLTSISNLQAGTRIIGSGNLDFSIDDKKDDEFGELSNAFNLMTFRLKTVTASKDELEKEILERELAEKALLEARDNLELKVEERTLELEKAYKSLKDREERLNLAQKAANIGTFEWNIQTDVNTWTPELETMYGLSPGTFSGTEEAWEELVHSEDRTEAIRGVNYALETGEPVEDEWRVIWPDGSVHWLYGRWQVFKDAEGNPLKMIGVNIDITKRKLAEEELKETIEELERSNKELQSFAYITSHDLQEPLRTIASYAQLIERRYKGQLDSDADEFLDFMVSGATRMKV